MRARTQNRDLCTRLWWCVFSFHKKNYDLRYAQAIRDVVEAWCQWGEVCKEVLLLTSDLHAGLGCDVLPRQGIRVEVVPRRTIRQ